MENLSILPNDGSKAKYDPGDFAISFGDTLRPQWLAGRKLVVLGNGNNDLITINRRYLPWMNGQDSTRGEKTFSFAVGWFDRVEITYKEDNEKYEVRNELLSETPIPRNPAHQPSDLKAYVLSPKMYSTIN
jgi:hypothetical protein